MEPTCINLKERFGRRYRVTYAESYRAEYGPGARTVDPQLMILKCRFGHIFPWCGKTLAASVDGHPKVANRLRRLTCCRIQQDGDLGELTVLFDVADFAKVAKILRPRLRRQLSEAQRERLRAMGYQKGRQAHCDVRKTARGGVSGAQDDSKPIERQMALFGP